MSRISHQIRAYVEDHDVSDHFGAWGTLRPDQRRLIRNLCDTCDMFEKTADLAVAERMANVKGFTEEVERLTIENQALRGAANSYKMHYEKGKSVVIKEFAEHLKERLFSFPTVYNSHFCRMIDDTVKEMTDTEPEIVKDSEHRCVYCQEIIPQGRQVCPKCEKGR